MRWGLLVGLMALVGFGSCLPTSSLSVDDYVSYAKGKPTKKAVGTAVIEEKHIVTNTTKRWVGYIKSKDGWQTTTENTDESFQKELVYVGLTGSTIRFLYREYRNDMARPAFSQDPVYDLSQSKLITFQNYKIRILEASNDFVKFVVISDGSGAAVDKWKDDPSGVVKEAKPDPISQATFDEKEFAPYSLNTKGTATISGQAFLKSKSGDVKYCAGNDVTALPSTTITREFWNLELYPNHPTPSPDPRVLQYARVVIANGEGRFRFESLPVGAYLLICRVDWYEGEKKVGGWAGARVDVAEKEQKDIIVRAIESELPIFAPSAARPDPAKPLTCGNGLFEKGEQCDKGKRNSDTAADMCRTNCTLPICGDNVVDANETCDDGNTLDGDGCPSSCIVAIKSCGNGAVDPGEQCDDGSANSEYGPCLPLCKLKPIQGK
jgi:cysteine-rich repeat protein